MPSSPDPLLEWRSPTRITHHANRTNEQQTSDIGIALRGDPAQPLLAASGVLSRRQTKPSGEVAAGAESLQIWYRRGNGGGGDRSDPGDGGQTLAREVRSMPMPD